MKHSKPRFLLACPSFRLGGWSTFALNLAVSLRKLGCETVLLVTDPFGNMYPSLRAAFDEIVVVRRRFEGRVVYLRRVVSAIDHARADAVVNNAVPFVQAALPFIVRPRLTVSVVHSPDDGEIAMALANVVALDHVVAVAENIASKVLAAAGPEHARKVVLLPPGVRLPPTRPAVARGSGPLRVVYVGRVTSLAKNLPLLERVLALAMERKLALQVTVAGDGDYLRAMKRNAAAAGYASSVRFAGALTPDAIGSLLDEADAILLTSTYEGSPQALIEAMSHGVVPVASRLAGATESLIDDGRDGFLCGLGRPDTFVDALARLAGDEALRGRMAAAARDKVRRSYDADTLAATYVSLLDAAAASSRATERNGPLRVAAELLPHCGGLLRQARRMLGDVRRGLGPSGERAVRT
jgi:glycosyltransferase involved in cell wall biosynthesis